MPIAFAKPNVPNEYLVDNRVYTDQHTFELELERIFLKTWNFVCHESEIPTQGDYIATSVAGVPIIICRNKPGELRAFYNTCRHRAAQVVRDAGGNAASFTCFYHLWSYDLDGTLIGAPEIEAYKTSYCPGGLGKEDLSLVPVRIETNARMIFVCFDQDGPSLADFLGPVLASNMHGPFGDPRVCVEVVWKKVLRANWKMAAENSRDGYHAPLLHKRLRGVSPPRPFKIYENSHTIQRMDVDYENGKRLGTLDGILAEKPEMIDAFMSHHHDLPRFPQCGAVQHVPDPQANAACARSNARRSPARVLIRRFRCGTGNTAHPLGLLLVARSRECARRLGSLGIAANRRQGPRVALQRDGTWRRRGRGHAQRR
jgi:phenylpropionate dioxygenase-like ring-hydroxylating dioxygenase large terminal subunit